jgi:tetratricopeptide (TPR) repeat protein
VAKYRKKEEPNMSDSSGNWFSQSSKKVSQQGLGVAPKPTPGQDFQPGAPYKKGDFIGQKYEVYDVLGAGGFGVVYLVYSHQTHEVYALKTFQDEFLANQRIRKRFQKEASVWVELGRHPYLVDAYFVDEISGRLYIAMEYIAPKKGGLNSLEGYLQRQPPDLAQSLRWAIQICHGMEYAYSKGVRAHRDLKPANIMITQDKTAKITDFGLAGVITKPPAIRTAGLSVQSRRSGLSGQTTSGTVFGTPTHMAPEQFDNFAGCDERSDIYSFGVVLYQMAAHGQLPFFAPRGVDFWQAMQRLHRESPMPRLDSPLFPIIQRCLEKSPERRYQTFNEVRNNLEPLLQHQTGEVITAPQSKELEAWEWSNKGMSLNSLGRDEEAIYCYDKALELDPRDAGVWSNKGNSLNILGQPEEAICCYDKALKLDQHDADVWSNKGSTLNSLGRYEEAILCCDKALKLDPNHSDAWTTKGNSLSGLGHDEEAICCYDKALELDPRSVIARVNKGNSLNSLGRNEEAIHCCDKALELDPRDVNAWTNKGNCLGSLGRYEEAIHCCDKALELDPHDAMAWFNKAQAEDELSQWPEAALSYWQFLVFAPAQDTELIEHARKRLGELGDSSCSE